MNPLYVQTFRRHRRLFIGIVVVALVSAMWMNLGAPKMYRSGVTIWADAPGADDAASGVTPPAAREQNTLTDLLALRSFRDEVARRGPLPAYLKSHPVEGWGPSAIIASLRGSGGAGIDEALSLKHVTSAVLGLHILQITFDAPSPAVAQKTLQGLVSAWKAERDKLPNALLTSYQQQLEQATAALSAAQEKLDQFRRRPGSAGSSKLKQLEAAAKAASFQRAADLKMLNSVLNAGSQPEPTVTVKDGPTLPAVPTTGHKKLIKGMLAGLFAGLLVSALGVVALARGPELVRGSDAVAPDLDLTDMSDAELARLIHDLEVDVDEEWPAANGNDGPPDELRKRRTSA